MSIQSLLKPAARTTVVNGSSLRPKSVALLELACLIAAIEIVLWTGYKRVSPLPVRVGGTVLLVATIVTLLFRQRPTRSQLGVSPAYWLAGTLQLSIATAIAMLVIFATGWHFETLGNVESFQSWLLRNWHLEGGQQLLLQGLLVPRLLEIFDNRRHLALTAAAVLFSLVHAPNLALMGLTLVAAAYWCFWFNRYRNLWALWVSHLLLAAACLYCLNGDWLRRLRVGIAYFYYS